LERTAKCAVVKHLEKWKSAESSAVVVVDAAVVLVGSSSSPLVLDCVQKDVEEWVRSPVPRDRCSCRIRRVGSVVGLNRLHLGEMK